MTDRSRSLRVGVVGCGGFGRSAYVNNVAENPDASLSRLKRLHVKFLTSRA